MSLTTNKNLSAWNTPDSSGFIAREYYLYANKQWEVIPSGIIAYTLASGVMQNAPVVITSSGFETTTPSDPWAQVEGSGKWTPRGHGFFTVTPAGVYDTTVKEFTMNPGSSGRIDFNQTLEEILYVEYEAWPSGYHDMDRININPLERETESGFLQITHIGEPVHLSLKATQSVMKGDGFHTSKLMASLYDSNLNRIEGKKIIFEMMFNIKGDGSGPYEDTGYLIPGKLDGGVYKVHPSGFVSETYAYTDKFGLATADVSTLAYRDGWMVFKAYYAAASGIFDTTEIVAYRWRRGQFILDYSMLDGLDYLDDVLWSASGIPGDTPVD